MDRRTLLKQLVLSSGGVLIAPNFLSACSTEKQPSLTGKFQIEPYASIEEMRNASLLCTGHLSEEMKRIIARKNAEEIYSFVHNHFSTIPSFGNSITNAAYAKRWGIRGLLRCGKGTIREKSDLLFYMLDQAGFSPKYYRQNFSVSPDILQNAFCIKKTNNNEFHVSQKYLDKWEETFKEHVVDELTIDIENSKEKSAELKNQLLKLLPENAYENIRNFDWLAADGIEIPVIRIQDKETIKDLNLLENKSYKAFSKTKNEHHLFDLETTSAKNNIEQVRVTLKATYNDNLNNPVDLVQGEWDLETLIGRQLAIQFAPTISTKQQLQSIVNDINSFVPFLTLRDLNMTAEERKNNSFQGKGFDMFGNTFEKDSNDDLRVNGIKMNSIDDSKISNVKSIKAKVVANNFPEVTVKVAPLDEKENVVLGLSGNSFSIKDQGNNQLAMITQNTSVVSILIFYDATASMPRPYASLEFPEEIKKKISKSFENESLTTQINVVSFSTEFLQDLVTVPIEKYDAVLCFGDGEAFEKVTPNALLEVLQGTPTHYFFVENGYSNQTDATVKNVFYKAGYKVSPITAIDESLPNIISSVQKSTLYPYSLTYNMSTKSNDSKHKVEVGITANDVTPVLLEYTVNQENNYKDHSFPVGLSLKIQWKEGYDTKSIEQHLVGFDIRKDESNSNNLKQFKNDFKSYILGTHYLCLEADQPTFPVLLDDTLSAYLSEVPLVLNENDTVDSLLEKLENSQPLPSEAIATFTGIQDDVSLHRVTFENRFQTCLYSEYYNINTESSIRKIDMLPTSDIRTFAPTKKEAFHKTLEQSILLALSEANIFNNSTYSDLKAKPLKLFRADEKHPLYPILQYSKDYYYHLLIDESLTTNSYWQINKSTGALLGILPDGSGGGAIVKKERMELALKVWEAWTNQVVKVTKGGMAMGIVALYGMFLAELYRLVALEINNLGAETDFEKDLKDLLKKYVKKGYKKIKKGIKSKK
ncbi:hypothetical protein ACOSP6_05735 [Tenacibaculum sp. MEBiC06402]|uniref:hypothetical protein n=1 Tax=unclassified Tenacibaculum TaxID=2635139 RepID=UPI003B9AD7C8